MADIAQPVKEFPLHSQKVLRLNAAITFLGFIDTHLLVPAMALFAAGLGASVGTAGLIIGVYSLTNTPANLLFGRLIDRVGYKVPLILGLLGDALSMFLYSLCRFPFQLGLVRAFHGTTGALIGPATMTISANYSPQARKGRAMGIYGMAMGITTLAGYGLSGVITSRLGYHALFLFGAALLLLGAILAFMLPRGRGETVVKHPAGGGLSRAKDLVKRKGLAAAYSSIFAQYFAFGGVVTLLPFYVSGLGMSSFHVGMLMAIFAITFIILQFPSGAISDRRGRLPPTIAGLSLGTISLVIMPSAPTFPMLALTMVLYGAGYGMLFPSISALIADHTGAEERGLAMGIFHASLTAGAAIGAPIIGWLGGIIGIETGLRLSASFMVLALILAIATIKRL